jgi:signal recognition particle receptor subunit alpha
MEQQIALNVQILKNRLRGRGSRRGGRGGGRTTSGRESADSEYVTNLLLVNYRLILRI